MNPNASDERELTEELFGAELFWEKNKSKILLGAVVVVVAIVGALSWVIYQHSMNLAAEKAFASAETSEAWGEVTRKFPASAPAAAARILLAESLRESGDAAASTAAYQSFLDNSPRSPLAGLARLGLAQNAEAAGDAARAITLLKDVAAERGYAAPLALFLAGRELAASGNFAEARSHFQALASEYPESLPARIVPGQLEQISLLEVPAPETPAAPVE